MTHARDDFTRILNRVASGDASASDEVVPVIYEELHRLAESQFAREGNVRTLQPTAVVNEAWIRLVDQGATTFDSRTHFFGVASRLIRQVLVDHARVRNARKRGGDHQRVTLSEQLGGTEEGNTLDLLALDEALRRLEALSEFQARIVHLRFFAGLTMDEVASLVQASKTTVEGHWRLAKAWLQRELS